jgi:hypothetical protein
LQIVHSPGGGERSCAAGAVAAFIKSPGARQGRLERCLRPCLSPRDRAGCWLTIKLRANRLARGRPGIRFVCGLPHGLLELRNRVAAGARMRRGAEKQNGDDESGCGSHDVSSQFECEIGARHLPPTVVGGKISFQSLFMLITTQPLCFDSS